MKLSKIISLIMAFVLLASLFSCDGVHIHNGNQNDQNQNDTSEENNESNEPVYVYSVTAKVLHIEGCYHIDRIKEEYRFEYTGDITVMIEKGYSLCKYCLAPEEEEPEEEEPEEEPEEDENKIPIEEATFVINTSSKKIHELDCRYAIEMKEENREYTNLSLEELLAIEDAEYSPCATCMPAEAEKYKEEHKDDNK